MSVQKGIAKSSEILRLTTESEDPSVKHIIRRLRRQWRIRGWLSKSSER